MSRESANGDAERIASEIAPVLEHLSLELYDLELLGTGANRVLRVKVDRDGGVDLDTVTEATRAVSPLVEEVIDGRFLLEVSSPGLERDLRTPRHFVRAIGSEVKVKGNDDEGATRRVRGALSAADDDGITVATEDGPVRFAYGDVTSARTIFEWNSEQ